MLNKLKTKSLVMDIKSKGSSPLKPKPPQDTILSQFYPFPINTSYFSKRHINVVGFKMGTLQAVSPSKLFKYFLSLLSELNVQPIVTSLLSFLTTEPVCPVQAKSVNSSLFNVLKCPITSSV
jgi:hypothetical protein